MTGSMGVVVFGPVSSRRLGMSLGICTLPRKTCSYSCVYCQLGPTRPRVVERRPYSSPEAVVDAVSSYLERLGDVRVDYATFIGYGEPSLDSMIAGSAEALRGIGLRVAVFTNSSLLPEALEDLLVFDMVSLKIDAADWDTWLRINRPHPVLRLEEILSAMEEFASLRRGRPFITETMLVAGLNDSRERLEAVAERLSRIQPTKAYISLPLRPPAEPWVEPPPPGRVVEAYTILAGRLGAERVELLAHLEEPVVEAAGDPERAVVDTASMHPLRLEEALRLLERLGSGPEVLDRLEAEGRIARVRYRGEVFIVAVPGQWRTGWRGRHT